MRSARGKRPCFGCTCNKSFGNISRDRNPHMTASILENASSLNSELEKSTACNQFFSWFARWILKPI